VATRFRNIEKLFITLTCPSKVPVREEGDVTVYLYHEVHYREQLAELKERHFIFGK